MSDSVLPRDVAAKILELKPNITAMKLQKLVYYSQAWTLAWDEEPLFKNRIEAWANGPVCPDLYELHRGEFNLSKISEGDTSNLKEEQMDNIKKVVKFYGDKSGHELSLLTHREDPWKKARKGVPLGERSDKEITHKAMSEFYQSLIA